jgi:hypothetical protein
MELAHDQTLLGPKYGAESEIELDAAAARAEVGSTEVDDPIACIHDLDRLQVHLLPSITHVCRPLAYPGVTLVRTAYSDGKELARRPELISRREAK